MQKSRKPLFAVVGYLTLLVAAAFAAFSLLPPQPAGASSSSSRQFAFAPVLVAGGASGQTIFCGFFNSGDHPSPPGSVAWFGSDGSLIANVPFDSVQPGHSFLSGRSPAVETSFSELVTFSHSHSGQEIPNPFPGAVSVIDIDTGRTEGVFGPAR